MTFVGWRETWGFVMGLFAGGVEEKFRFWVVGIVEVLWICLFVIILCLSFGV